MHYCSAICARCHRGDHIVPNLLSVTGFQHLWYLREMTPDTTTTPTSILLWYGRVEDEETVDYSVIIVICLIPVDIITDTFDHFSC